MTDHADIHAASNGIRTDAAGGPVPLTRRSWRRVLVHVPDAAPELIEQLWTGPDDLMASGEMIKNGDRSTVVLARADDRTFIIKRYNLRGPLHTMCHWVMRSRARWSWLNGRRLREGGLHSPRPLAYAEERFGLCRMRSFLVTENHPGRTLFDLVHEDRIDGDRIAALAAQFAEIWRGLDRLRIGHGDMKATNFIVDADNRIWLVDLDALRTYPRGPVLRARRRSDLERFMRNWRDAPHAAAAFRDALGIADAPGG